MKNTNWVICAAGAGTRFKKIGLKTTKPLLNIEGQSFLDISLSSIPIKSGDKIIILSQSSDNIESNYIKYKDMKIEHIKVKNLTRGQLDTFYLAKDSLDINFNTAIWNCDTHFSSKIFEQDIMSDYDGLVPCGILEGERWSFFKTDKELIVNEVKEKSRISDNCSVGMYFFKDTALLLKVTKDILKNQKPLINKEYFVSQLYPEYIKRNMKIKVSLVDAFKPFGTIEDIIEYWSITETKFKEMNS